MFFLIATSYNGLTNGRNFVCKITVGVIVANIFIHMCENGQLYS